MSNRFIPGPMGTPGMTGMPPEFLRNQAEAELRKARIWMVVVGCLIFTIDMAIMKFVIGGFDHMFVAIDVGVLVSFLALAFFAKYKPVLCCVLALVVYWGLQLFVASIDPSTLAQGILIKVLFTLAMVRGIKTAGHVEDLRKQLDNVFG